jgi:saccharopine dehydrogenase-like NADP-dependent oxidoreductase
VKVLVNGLGAVGARAARFLVASDEVELLLVADVDSERRDAVARSLGGRAKAVKEHDDVGSPEADVVLLAAPATRQAALAADAVSAGRHVVATADSIPAVRGMLDLDAEAQERRIAVVAGCGFSPGLSCVLARHAASQFDEVDEIHVARHGTGGPACARQHHSALRGRGIDWQDRGWTRRPPGSGRELSFFPDPVGGLDCYRAALPDALLLVPAFPGIQRATARLAATRRDRWTAALPMLRRPHPEGKIGGLRVEVRGRRGPVHDTVVLGAIDRPAVAAGTVAGLAVRWAGQGQIDPGANGLASLDDPLRFLHELADAGVRAAVFEGTSASVG